LTGSAAAAVVALDDPLALDELLDLLLLLLQAPAPMATMARTAPT
jgi:hypothetical protein